MIAIELAKQTRRPRAWVTLLAMVAIPIVLTVIIGATRPTIAERVGDFGSVVTNTSGLTMPLIVLSAMLLFMLPLAVAIFAGECVAGEASWGSLRYLLARPVPRWRVLGAKAAVAGLYSLAAVALVVLVSLVAGSLAFGIHPLTVLDLQHTTPFIVASARLQPLTAVARLALSTAYVLGTLTSTFAFALLLSTLSVRPFSAVAGAVGLGLFSRALDNIPGLHALSPWLPMTDQGTSLWTGFFTQPMQTSGMAHVMAVQAGYTALFLGAALLWFTRSDVLS
ncbi:MAG TPA: ABC transporter permease [Solirubrobacteraceae bacterium]|nr:ABC transporter permease [Solirubrobacteraceae bacterium]